MTASGNSSCIAQNSALLGKHHACRPSAHTDVPSFSINYFLYDKCHFTPYSVHTIHDTPLHDRNMAAAALQTAV